MWETINSAIYINEKLLKVKEITCALTTSVIWTTRLTKTSEFSSPFNGENHICWNTLVTSSWEKIKTWVWQLHLMISFNSSWYHCNLQQSRKKYFFEMSGLLAPLIGDTKATQRSQTRNYLKYPCQKLSEQTSNDLKKILTSFTHVT